MKKGIIVLLGLFLIPSFSSADNVYTEDVPSNFIIGNYTYSVDNNINFTTNSTGNFIEYKYTPSYNKYYHFFGWIDNKLYYVSYDLQQVQGYIQGRQGFINSFCATNNLSTRCTNFNVSAEDFYAMNKNITKIAIFIGGNDYADPFGLCFYNSLNELYYCAYGAYAKYSGATYYSSLTGNIGFSSESEIRNYLRGTSPYTPENTTPNPDTNDVCITVQQFFDIYGSTNNYNTGLCYTQDRYLTQTGRIQVTPKFITELYPTYQEFRQDVNTRHNYCTPPATQQTCQQAFNGKEENRTLINKLQEGTDTAIIYDMCVIYQTRSGNMQKNFCDMTQEEAEIIGKNTMTTEKYAERIANNNTTITIPTTGTVYDGLTDGTNRDILEAIPRVYTKITGIFKGRAGKDGIIPYYITGILLVIVLFKLFKK